LPVKRIGQVFRLASFQSKGFWQGNIQGVPLSCSRRGFSPAFSVGEAVRPNAPEGMLELAGETGLVMDERFSGDVSDEMLDPATGRGCGGKTLARTVPANQLRQIASPLVSGAAFSLLALLRCETQRPCLP
jgi:hypothetical protein